MTPSLYDQDFYAWTQEQAQYLRAGKWEALDLENLGEEIESLGKQQRQELRHRLGILLGDLLKWHYQPAARSQSWKYTVRQQRREIARHLRDNPSLKPYLTEAIAMGYEDGLDLIGQETPLDPQALPQSCPFAEEQIFTEPLDL